MAKVKKKAKGAAKKRWIQILAPKIFNHQLIGETYVYESRQALGKPVTVNLMTLTRNPKNQGINVKFVVTGQHEDKLTSDFIGFRIMPSVVRRMVRRGRNKIVDSFVCITSDGKKVRVKPLVVTRTKAKGSVLTGLRKLVRQYLKKTIAKTNYETLAGDIIDHKLQKEMRMALSKTFPLASCEIRWFVLVKEKTVPGAKKKEEPKPAKAEEKEKAEISA